MKRDRYENPFFEEKKKRLNRTLEILKGSSPIEFTRAVAMLEMNLGASKEKAKEYIFTLRDFGSVEIKNGLIYYKEKDK
jgi:hypothetical protein